MPRCWLALGGGHWLWQLFKAEALPGTELLQGRDGRKIAGAAPNISLILLLVERAVPVGFRDLASSLLRFPFSEGASHNLRAALTVCSRFVCSSDDCPSFATGGSYKPLDILAIGA